MPRALRPLEHRRREHLPELRIDVLRGIDAKTVHGEFIDPGAVDVDEPLNDARILCHEIIEAGEVAHRGLSPLNVESPRLWYQIGSLSQAGTFTLASPLGTNGVYAKSARVSFTKFSAVWTLSPAKPSLMGAPVGSPTVEYG